MNKQENRNKTLSIRLTEKEYKILKEISTAYGMSNGEYIRSLIRYNLPDYRMDKIAPVICQIYIRLQELGLDSEDITMEVAKLCQM